MSDPSFRPDQDAGDPADVAGRTPLTPEELNGNDEPPPPMDSVPVFLDNEWLRTIPRPTPRWETGQHQIGGQGQNAVSAVVGDQPARRAIGVKNVSTSAVVVGPRQEMTSTTGFVLKAGESIVLDYRGPIFAALFDPDDDPGRIAWSATFEDG